MRIIYTKSCSRLQYFYTASWVNDIRSPFNLLTRYFDCIRFRYVIIIWHTHLWPNQVISKNSSEIFEHLPSTSVNYKYLFCACKKLKSTTIFHIYVRTNETGSRCDAMNTDWDAGWAYHILNEEHGTRMIHSRIV